MTLLIRFPSSCLVEMWV